MVSGNKKILENLIKPIWKRCDGKHIENHTLHRHCGLRLRGKEMYCDYLSENFCLNYKVNESKYCTSTGVLNKTRSYVILKEDEK